jgi:D-alanine-D-alanine ligase-like ATP-grasp enzyme
MIRNKLEHIEKAVELRVVVIGRQIFAVEIHSQHSPKARLDWRRAYSDLTYAVHQLPAQLEEKLRLFVRMFALQYSSMDLILTPSGEYVWLEANPNGQFLWLSAPTGLPMAEAMANLLMDPEEYGLWE